MNLRTWLQSGTDDGWRRRPVMLVTLLRDARVPSACWPDELARIAEEIAETGESAIYEPEIGAPCCYCYLREVRA